MIIWINGAFGSGKTQTAFELHRRLPNSYVYDPENVGFFLRKNQPPNMQLDNFQDDPIWRKFNFDMLLNISRNYKGILIVPMTICKAEYFNEIITRLRENSIQVDHYVLEATKDEILKRLRKRLENKNTSEANQIDECINSFRNPIFASQIDTNHLTIEQVVEIIADKSNLEITPNEKSIFLKTIKRIETQIRHIRKN